MRSSLSLGAVGFMAALAGMLVSLTIGVAVFMATSDDDDGGGDGPAPTETAEPEADVVLVANNIAFDLTEIRVPAGEPFTILLDNQEPVPHNVAVYTDNTTSEAIAVGDVITGPATSLLEVPALEAGEYYFHCDVHPQMNGALFAE